MIGSKFANFNHFWFCWVTQFHESRTVHPASVVKSKGTISVELGDTVIPHKLFATVWIFSLQCDTSGNKEE